MKRLFSLFLALSFVFVSTADAGKIVKLKKKAPIHIAYWFVTSGANTSLGIDTKRGCELAIADFGGKIMGHKVKLSGHDEMCSPEGGQTAASKIASDPTILAAIGSNCSSAASAGVPILWKMGIPTVSPSNTSPTLTAKNRGSEFDGYLRTCHNDLIQGEVAAKFAYKKMGAKKAATIHDGSVYADKLQEVFVETFKKLGGTITSQEAVGVGDTDMRPVLTKIATQSPEFIYLPIFIAEAAFITRQAKEVAGLENVPLMSADGSYAPDYLRASGKAAIGVFHSSPDFSAFSGKYESFKQAHKKKYGIEPENAFHAHAYDATLMILTAIKKVATKGKKGTLLIDRTKLNTALHKTKGLKGLTGTINCDEMGDCADPKIAVYQVSETNLKEGKMSRVPYWSEK